MKGIRVAQLRNPHGRGFVVKVNGRIRNRKYLTRIQAINACAYIMAGVEPARALRRAREAK